MELTRAQIDIVESQSSLSAISKEHSSFENLKEAFGLHTYFLNEQGLFVFRKADDSDGEARLFAFAKWMEEDKNKLVALPEPVVAGIVLDLNKPELSNVDGAGSTRH